MGLTIVYNTWGKSDTLSASAKIIHHVQISVHYFATDEGTGSSGNEYQTLWLESPEAERDLAAIPHVNKASGPDVEVELQNGESPEEIDFFWSRGKSCGRKWRPGAKFVRFVDNDPAMSWRMRLDVS